MAKPTKKSQLMEDLINSFNPSGRKRVDSITKNICAWCGQPVTSFRDELSKREYAISGFCQACQDKTFGKDEDAYDKYEDDITGPPEDDIDCPQCGTCRERQYCHEILKNCPLDTMLR